MRVPARLLCQYSGILEVPHADGVGCQRHRGAIGLFNICGQPSEEILKKSSATAQAFSGIRTIIHAKLCSGHLSQHHHSSDPRMGRRVWVPVRLLIGYGRQ